VRSVGGDVFAGAPGVRDPGADEDEVAIFIVRDVVADEALAAAVEGEGEFVFLVVMPLEGDCGEAPVEERPGAVVGRGDAFKVGLHRG